jgi:hypothetical protein
VITFLAYELLTGSPLDELPFESFRWTDVLNRPGGFSATIPARHPKATRTTLEPWRTCIYAVSGDRILTGGVITKVSATIGDDATVSVEGVGPLGYYGRRFIRSGQGMTWATTAGPSEVRFQAVDQLRIASDLLGHAHAATGGNPFGLTTNMVTGLSGQVRDRSFFTYERKNILDALEQLAAVRDGFDFAASASWGPTGPEWSFDLWYPRRGASLAAVFDATNLEAITETVNGEPQANDVTALGAGDGDDMWIRTSTDVNRIYPTGRFPLLERVSSYRDVSVAATLEAHAAADRLESTDPVQSVSISLSPTPDVPVGAYNVGDDVEVYISDGWTQLADRLRIQSLNYQLTPSGDVEIGAELASMAASLQTD